MNPYPGGSKLTASSGPAHPKPDHAFNLPPVGVVKKPLRRRHLEGPVEEGT
jgi:hypothetical protein